VKLYESPGPNLDPPKDSRKIENCIKIEKRDYRILLSPEEVCYDKMKKVVRRHSQEEHFEINTF
jgi:hypothetical protein